MQNIWQRKQQTQSLETGAHLVYLRNSQKGSVAA